MKRILAYLICLFALLLPWRLRVAFAGLLGWITQGIYGLLYAVMRILVKNLRNDSDST